MCYECIVTLSARPIRKIEAGTDQEAVDLFKPNAYRGEKKASALAIKAVIYSASTGGGWPDVAPSG